MSDTSPSEGLTTSQVNQPASRLRGGLVRGVAQLMRWRNWLFGVGLMLITLAIVPSQQLSLEKSIQSLFPPGHHLIAEYQRSRELFGGDEFVMIAWKQPDLLKPAGLDHIKTLAAEFSEIPGVNPASTQTLEAVLRPPQMGFIGHMFLRVTSVREKVLHFSEGALVGKDRQTTAIVLRLIPENQTTVPREQTFAQILDKAAAQNPPAFVVGEPVQVHDMFEIVERDGALLGWASSAILLIIIGALFRSLRWMLLPILVVQASLLWTRALLVLSGIRLSMVSSMLDSLVTIIGIATVMHITISYRELRLKNSPSDSLFQVLCDLMPAIFWTCLTTAVGFGALLSSQVVPIQSFGVMMGIGTLMVLLAVILLVPGGVLLGRKIADPGQYRWEDQLERGLLKLSGLAIRWPKTLGGLVILLATFGFAGLPYLKIETDFSKNFHDQSPIVQSLNFVENNLGGAGNYEVNFPFESLEDEEALDRLRQLADDLRALEVEGQPAVTKVVAYTDGIDFIPGIAGQSIAAKREVLNEMQPEFEPSLYNADKKRMRIILRALERQPAELKLAMVDQITEKTRDYFPGAEHTGLYVLLANIIQSLLSDQIVSFGWASLGIFLMMTLAFQSWKIGLISLIPNLLPILVLIGTLGWVGSLINIGTAMIASVSIGLTVDSSIHYLSCYFREKRAGHSHVSALEITQRRVGISLVFSNLALVCGFSVLTLSEFVPLNYFGVLVSIAMLGGLIGNLILLPLLLTWLYGPRTASATSSEVVV